jgi:hypothetical protein
MVIHMQNWKILIMTNYAKADDGLIHFVNVSNAEYTICGDAFEGSNDNDGAAWVHVKRGPVTCSKCIAIIKSCKGVKTHG